MQNQMEVSENMIFFKDPGGVPWAGWKYNPFWTIFEPFWALSPKNFGILCRRFFGQPGFARVDSVLFQGGPQPGWEAGCGSPKQNTPFQNSLIWRCKVNATCCSFCFILVVLREHSWYFWDKHLCDWVVYHNACFLLPENLHPPRSDDDILFLCLCLFIAFIVLICVYQNAYLCLSKGWNPPKFRPQLIGGYRGGRSTPEPSPHWDPGPSSLLKKCQQKFQRDLQNNIRTCWKNPKNITLKQWKCPQNGIFWLFLYFFCSFFIC